MQNNDYGIQLKNIGMQLSNICSQLNNIIMQIKNMNQNFGINLQNMASQISIMAQQIFNIGMQVNNNFNFANNLNVSNFNIINSKKLNIFFDTWKGVFNVVADENNTVEDVLNMFYEKFYIPIEKNRLIFFFNGEIISHNEKRKVLEFGFKDGRPNIIKASFTKALLGSKNDVNKRY